MLAYNLQHSETKLGRHKRLDPAETMLTIVLVLLDV